MKRSVFYFDDDATLLDIFQETFEDQYDIRTTTKLAVARRMLSECAADIIISDQSTVSYTHLTLPTNREV